MQKPRELCSPGGTAGVSYRVTTDATYLKKQLVIRLLVKQDKVLELFPCLALVPLLLLSLAARHGGLGLGLLRLNLDLRHSAPRSRNRMQPEDKRRRFSQKRCCRCCPSVGPSSTSSESVERAMSSIHETATRSLDRCTREVHEPVRKSYPRRLSTTQEPNLCGDAPNSVFYCFFFFLEKGSLVRSTAYPALL